MVLLKNGSCGDEVRYLQEVLNLLIRTPPPLQVDGIFGPKTKTRVVQFQRTSGLVPDGIVGPLTTKALVGRVLDDTFNPL
jgi:peptidoglycan hydrolase-like protein with peptidoglycan-binding domain